MKKNLTINVNIREWWIDWWRDDKCYWCALIEINKDKLQYVEREIITDA